MLNSVLNGILDVEIIGLCLRELNLACLSRESMTLDIFTHKIYSLTCFQIKLLPGLMSEQEVYIGFIGETFYPLTVDSWI